MPLANPYQQYRSTAVNTADKGQLLVMSYEALLRWLTRARTAIEGENTVVAHEALVNAQQLVANLSLSLDFEKGKEIAENLRSIYDYLTERLIWANIQKDVAVVDEIVELVRPLSDAWRVAVNDLRRGAPQPASASA